MAKQNNKKLRMHPLHFHLGLYLTLAALLVTAAKTSGELIKSMYAIPVYYDVASSTHMKEAETLHGQANLVIARRAFVAGQ